MLFRSAVAVEKSYLIVHRFVATESHVFLLKFRSEIFFSAGENAQDRLLGEKSEFGFRRAILVENDLGMQTNEMFARLQMDLQVVGTLTPDKTGTDDQQQRHGRKEGLRKRPPD